MRKGNSETGTLVMLPKFTGGDVRPIIASMVNPALGWLGLEERIKVDSFRMVEGAPWAGGSVSQRPRRPSQLPRTSHGQGACEKGELGCSGSSGRTEIGEGNAI